MNNQLALKGAFNCHKPLDHFFMRGKKGKPYPGESSMRVLTTGERRVTGLGSLMINSTPRGDIIFWRLGTNGKILKTSVSWAIRRALKSYWG